MTEEEWRLFGQLNVRRQRMSERCTVTTWSCGLYRNPMLCERLAGRTRILLRVDRTAKFSKLSDLCIIIFIRFDITLLGLL